MFIKRKELRQYHLALLQSRFIVQDPKICHGAPTFKGTRILVSDVLEMVALGLDWDTIIEEWRGEITKEAIAEAIQLAREAFLKNITKIDSE